ncbi:hypothetical protein HRbin08_00813 [bacterium HR08]|nr:hypothetical protein HRbin08_00813 [bacterium HR08]
MRRLIRIDARMFNDDLLPGWLRRGLRLLQAEQEPRAIEEDIDIPGPGDLDASDPLHRWELGCDRFGQGARRVLLPRSLAQPLSELKGDGKSQVPQLNLRRNFNGDLLHRQIEPLLYALPQMTRNMLPQSLQHRPLSVAMSFHL